jgi:dipeptidyl aminopeptidase/acylaminoacyl peptidase
LTRTLDEEKNRMAAAQVAPYGSWKSPITSDLIVAGTVSLGQIALDGDEVYWVESRPAERGRNVVVRRVASGRTEDVTPPPFDVRSRAHEYGGGAFAVADSAVYFSNFADQRLYRQAPGSQPRPITPTLPLQFADGVVDRARRRLICVREDHRAAGHEAANALVGVALDGDEQGGRVLVGGNDFYASPRLSPDGRRLAWLTWNHPNMPWDGSELWVGELDAEGGIGRAERVAGGERESVFQPEWSPDGALYFIADPTGWWNLYRWRAGRVEPLCERAAEFGMPQWVFGMSTYAVASADELVCSYVEAGGRKLATLDTRTLELRPFDLDRAVRGNVRADARRAVFLAGSPSEASAIVSLELPGGQRDVLRRSSDLRIDPGYISPPEAVEFPTEGGLTAHAFFYPPRNHDFRAPAGARPPLLVLSHGGPTGATSPVLNPAIQYWTSRGIAVVDVNYGGSTGYGRAYRERLNDNWGVVDVDDCVNAARFLVGRGLADPDRLAIRGGSAGGYTTLAALTFRDVFRAGASYYGISDLEAMAKETHKFESRYLDRLVGPYPERRDRYLERSPIHFTERLDCPLILFQGLEDKVVPPNQAELMFEAVKRKGLPVAYVPFEGEQHGFRQAHNIKRALDAELYFYSRIFGFDLAEPVEPVRIENL